MFILIDFKFLSGGSEREVVCWVFIIGLKNVDRCGISECRFEEKGFDWSGICFLLRIWLIILNIVCKCREENVLFFNFVIFLKGNLYFLGIDCGGNILEYL